jgi:uncharacterized protein with PQ loop repeat
MVLFHSHVSVSSLDFGVTKKRYSLLLFLVFFPRRPDVPQREQPEWRTAVAVAFLCLIHGVVTAIISLVFITRHPGAVQAWANVLGITAAVLACVQYFPQIWTTYRLRHVGSLSIPMMVIQTPGSFVWAWSLFSRYGISGWSTWGVYCVTGCLQGCLLVMGINFEIQARRRGEEDDVSNVSLVRLTLILNFDLIGLSPLVNLGLKVRVMPTMAVSKPTMKAQLWSRMEFRARERH